MSEHTMDEQYVAELLTRLAAARKAQREAELVAADQASEFDHLRAVIRNVLAEPEADDKKLAGGLGTIAWLLRFLVQDSPQPQGLLQAAKEAAKLQKDQLETMSPILYRLNQAAAAAVGLSEHAPEDEILGRLAELRQILHDLVGDDALGSNGLVAAAKAKIEDLKRREELTNEYNKMCSILRFMVPHHAAYSDTETAVTEALDAWQAASRRSALFQKTGQELGLTDSASPEQILHRAQEVAMILRSRSQAQDFDANLLAMLGLPANTSRDAVLDAVKKLVAFWVDSVQPAVLASAIKRPSDDSARDLALLQDKITYELGLLSPQLPDCREGLGKAGSLLRLLAQPDRNAALVDLAHAKVKEMKYFMKDDDLAVEIAAALEAGTAST